MSDDNNNNNLTSIELDHVGFDNASKQKQDEEEVAPGKRSNICKTFLLILLSPLILVLALLAFLVIGFYSLICLPCLLSDRFARQSFQEPSESDKSSLPNGGSYQKAKSGVTLYYQIWRPNDSITPRAILLISHGFGEHCNRLGYQSLARKMNEIGVIVIGIDHQGHGRSMGTRAYYQSISHVVDDFIAIAAHSSQDYKHLPLFLYGHSMGGLLALLISHSSMENSSLPLSGMILSSPAVMVDPEVATPFMVFLARVLSRLTPRLQLDSLPSSHISRNVEAVKVYDTDILNFRGGVRARLATEMLGAQASMKKLLPNIKLPTLCLHGTKDLLVPSAASQFVFDHIGTQDKTLTWYPGGFHEVIEDEEFGDKYIQDIAEFIQSKIPAAAAAPANSVAVTIETSS